MNKRILSLLFVSSLVGLTGCENQQQAKPGADRQVAVSLTSQQPVQRWYSQAQVARGDPLFQENCASCHKPDASGTPNWRETDAQGKYPPPPLNGTSHAWHHPLSILRQTVRVGGVPLGGTMPGFAQKLDAEQVDDVLAWVQSHWSDEIYGLWHERNEQLKRQIAAR